MKMVCRNGKLYSTASAIRLAQWAVMLLIMSQVGCSAIHPVASHIHVSRKIQSDDFDDLREGNLLAIRDRYEDRGINNLNSNELAILCDIYTKHLSMSSALECLDAMQASPEGDEISHRIRGKQALIAYLSGQYGHAAALTSKLKDDGAQYVHALAQTRMGNNGIALDTAKRWARAYDPEHLFLAANLYLANERYKDALDLLKDPERRMARDYSLTGGRSITGKQIPPAPLKVDLFDEFGFGLMDTYSYAPAANVYVEFILAKSEQELGNLAQADRRWDMILSYPHIAAFREIYWRALYERARISKINGQITEAITLCKRAVDSIESVRSSISTEAGRIGFVGDKQDVYATLIKLLNESGHIRAAFEYTERARSRALVDVLSTQSRFAGRAAVHQYHTDNSLKALDRAERRLLELSGTRSAGKLMRSTSDLKIKRRQILRRDPMLSRLVTVDPAKTELETIQHHLSPGETMLSYFKAEDNWYIFLLTRSEFHQKQIDLPANLELRIGAFRRFLIKGAKNDVRNTAQALYNGLIRPVAERLTDTLIIVPFGALHYLPFAALHSGSDFLVENHTLLTLPSAEVLSILKPQRPGGSMLVFGNPWGDLPGAGEEAQRVSQAHKPSRLLIGAEASRKRFQDLAPKYNILHLAAHGEFVPDDPLRSRLLLAPSDGDSGDLTVEDLYTMEPPLRASIAVLSACETALSKVANGNELIGLQRGFLYAGANSIIGSLWRIPDENTVYLMEQFYASLGSGDSFATALRHAQIKALEQNPDVQDWAAFTYTGSAH